MAHYFIVEHKSRGAYVGYDHHRSSGEWVPKFRHSILRTDYEVRRFTTRPEAERELAKISRTVPGCYLVPLKR